MTLSGCSVDHLVLKEQELEFKMLVWEFCTLGSQQTDIYYPGLPGISYIVICTQIYIYIFNET